MNFLEEVRRAQDTLSSARRILCMCHRGPDGDAIGSLLGMGLLLERKMPHIQVLLFCKDTAPEPFHFLPSVKRIQQLPDPQAGDVIVTLDCAVAKQTDFHESHPALFDGTYPCINIDHHQDNPYFGTINIVLPQAASTCEIVASIADALEWNITSDIATCLLTGVYTDTGGLLHSNTSAQVYRTVARLLREGAGQQAIIQAIFRTAKVSTLKLWGRVLEKITITSEGGAISAVTKEDFIATGADYAELTGAIDYVNAVPGMRFSLILSERDGKVKGSLRTLREDVDVAEMASKFSGGGHKKAAGFALSGKLQPEVRWKVVPEDGSSSDPLIAG